MANDVPLLATRLPILLVVAIAFVAQLAATPSIRLGLDGGLSLALGIVPLSEALRFLARDVHPPLYYVALRGWLALAGTSPFAAKYVGVACTTLSVASFATWTERCLGRRASLRAGLLMAVSPIVIGDGATVRDLAPGLFVVILNCWAFVETRQQPDRSFWTYLHLVTGAVAVWTSFLAVGVLFAQTAYLLAQRKPLFDFVPLIAIGLSVSPWLAFSFRQGWLSTLTSGGPTTGSPTPTLVADVRSTIEFLLTGSDGPGARVPAVFVTVALLGLVPAIIRRRKVALAPLVFPALVSTLVFAILVASSWLRLGLPARYLAPAIPFWILLVVGLAEQAGPVWASMAVGSLLIANLLSLSDWYRQPTLPPTFWDPVGVQTFLDREVGSDDSVVFLTLEQAGYYAALSTRPRPWVAVPVGTSYLERDVGAEADQKLSPLLTSRHTVWVISYHGVLGDGQRAVEAWLARRAYPLAKMPLKDSDAQPYLTDVDVGVSHDVEARFADGVSLAAATFPSSVRAGDPVPLRLTWHADHPLSRDLTVFVHLVDARGSTIAQRDARPSSGYDPTTTWNGSIVDRRAIAVTSQAKTGDYWFEVGLYDTAGRLPVQGRPDGTVRLGPIHVQGVS